MYTIEQCREFALHPPHAHGAALANGVIRQQAGDFVVDEIPLCEPAGEGEHAWLKIRKRHANTDYVAKQLQRFAGVKPVAVSYAGLKDRHAVTTQWFSVHLPGQADPDWQQLDNDEFEVLAAQRHTRKLKRGTLKGNRFRILVRDVTVADDLLNERAQAIATQGVPNYFASQRFGHGGENLDRALAMLSGERRVKRQQRSIYLSAARSLLFNYILGQRVTAQTWNTLQVGDVCQLTGRRGAFRVDELDETILQRFAAGEIQPTGPLWGEGELPTAGEVAVLEATLPNSFPDWCAGLEQARLKMERRALRLVPGEFRCQRTDAGVELSFSLPAGAYATAVLGEMFELIDYSRRSST